MLWQHHATVSHSDLLLVVAAASICQKLACFSGSRSYAGHRAAEPGFHPKRAQRIVDANGIVVRNGFRIGGTASKNE